MSVPSAISQVRRVTNLGSSPTRPNKLAADASFSLTATDVYALGCVRYELLTGRAPFTGARPWFVVQQHGGAVPVPPARLCPEILGPLDDFARDPAHAPPPTIPPPD
ncbi:hypothetical protein GCM10018780_49150 [Streptomyces lanatus]|nr:hypothetical protein GCM10018780_49150 [Streptomyces lanatus]